MYFFALLNILRLCLGGFITKIDYQLVGKRIAKIRHEKKLTQENLAEKAGITNNYLSNIERNRSIPSLETLMSICTALSVTPNEILIGTDDTQTNYLTRDICNLIEKCTPYERKIIISIIDILIDNRQ